eukprot:CAMPEP_0184020340 /NCGR_PEP_ID=MMETSP0954-20121128/9295_1 /TAXON_ID=627963 /ORGANISM="Aplanochytrium sp, Strain PBS07" /LENGTH=315 /DNA_ID=CAMNT_0026302191 /DNA_START=1433 /DNA_END=2380 /DNA_ORIENTATION=-
MRVKYRFEVPFGRKPNPTIRPKTVSFEEDATLGEVVELAIDALVSHLNQLGDLARGEWSPEQIKSRISVKAGFPPRELNYSPLTRIDLASKHGITKNALLQVSLNEKKEFKFVQRVVPADNSCLFMTVAYLAMERTRDPKVGNRLREICIDQVLSNSSKWTEAILGVPPDEYVKKLADSSTWGSYVELVILADYLGIEFVAIDVQSLQPLSAGNPEESENIAFLLFDGIHYDAFARSPVDSTDESQDQTVFSRDERGDALKQCVAIAASKNKHRQFTDVKRFKLRCLTCDKGLKGQEEAVSHANSNPGHINFGEY